MSQLKPESTSGATKQQIAFCAVLVTAVQRELAVFLTASVSLFGSRQVTLAADAWIADLTSFESVAALGSGDWLLVATKALSWLAHHLVNVWNDRMSPGPDAAKKQEDTVASIRLDGPELRVW